MRHEVLRTSFAFHDGEPVQLDGRCRENEFVVAIYNSLVL